MGGNPLMAVYAPQGNPGLYIATQAKGLVRDAFAFTAILMAFP